MVWSPLGWGMGRRPSILKQVNHPETDAESECLSEPIGPLSGKLSLRNTKQVLIP
ncbi:MAG: hypothetical protein Q4A84_06290 [Neisseria sp.]|uniref:hypothetical protein n=1 Tax=Neisseria sp. TaxID=192066 RepID=UPI0026DC0097|nr:hypothetical protein [Neisseria sp.]MDO4641294.1 hypothetical protein [Neisseria sp.]